jgi:hypothetical protein
VGLGNFSAPGGFLRRIWPARLFRAGKYPSCARQGKKTHFSLTKEDKPNNQNLPKEAGRGTFSVVVFYKSSFISLSCAGPPWRREFIFKKGT